MSLFFHMCFQCAACASGRKSTARWTTSVAVAAARSCTRAPSRAAATRVSTSRASSTSSAKVGSRMERTTAVAPDFGRLLTLYRVVF